LRPEYITGFAFFRKHIQEWRLRQLDCERLLERSVKDLFAGSVDEVGQQDSVPVRQRDVFSRIKEVNQSR